MSREQSWMMYSLGQFSSLVFVILMSNHFFLIQCIPQLDRGLRERVITKRSYAGKQLLSDNRTSRLLHTVTPNAGPKNVSVKPSTEPFNPVGSFEDYTTRKATEINHPSNLSTATGFTIIPVTTIKYTTFPLTTTKLIFPPHTTNLKSATRHYATIPPSAAVYTIMSPTTLKHRTISPVSLKQTTIIPITSKETTNIPITSKETTVLPKTDKETTVTPISSKETTNIPITSKETTVLPITDKETSVTPISSKETTNIPITSKETTVLPITDKETSVTPITSKETTNIPKTAKETTVLPITDKETTIIPITAKGRTISQITSKETTSIPISAKGTTVPKETIIFPKHADLTFSTFTTIKNTSITTSKNIMPSSTTSHSTIPEASTTHSTNQPPTKLEITQKPTTMKYTTHKPITNQRNIDIISTSSPPILLPIILQRTHKLSDGVSETYVNSRTNHQSRTEELETTSDGENVQFKHIDIKISSVPSLEKASTSSYTGESTTPAPYSDTTSQKTYSGSHLGSKEIVSADQLPGNVIEDYDVTSPPQPPDIEHEEDIETYTSDINMLTEDLDNQKRSELKSDLENWITKKPVLENWNTQNPELEIWNTQKPDLGIWNTQKLELENWHTEKSDLEKIIYQKPDIKSTVGDSEQKDGGKETLKKSTRSQVSEVDFGTDKTSAVTSTVTIYLTKFQTKSTDPVTSAGHSTKTLASATVAMATPSKQNILTPEISSTNDNITNRPPNISSKNVDDTRIDPTTATPLSPSQLLTFSSHSATSKTASDTLTYSTTITESTKSPTSRDTTAVHGTHNAFSDEKTAASKNLKFFHSESSSQNVGTTTIESSSQPSEEIIRTTARKLLEQTPAETGPSRKTLLTSTSQAQTSTSKNVTTTVSQIAIDSSTLHSQFPKRKLSGTTASSNSTPLKSPLPPQSTRVPSILPSSTPQSTTTLLYYHPDSNTTNKTSLLSSTHSSVSISPLTTTPTSKLTQDTKSYKTLPTTAPAANNISLTPPHTSAISNTTHFQTTKTVTTAHPMGFDSSPTTFHEILGTTTKTTVTSASMQTVPVPATTLSQIPTTRQSTSLAKTTSLLLSSILTSSALAPSTVPTRSSGALVTTTTAPLQTVAASIKSTTSSTTSTSTIPSSSTSTMRLTVSSTLTTLETTSPTLTSQEITTPTITSQETTSTITTKTAPLRLQSRCHDNSSCSQSVNGSFCWKETCACDWDRYPSTSGTCISYNTTDFTIPSFTSQSNSSFTIQLPKTSLPANVSFVYNVCWNDTLRVCEQASGDSPYVMLGLTPGTVYTVMVKVIISRADLGRNVSLTLATLSNITDPPDVGEYLKTSQSPDGRQMTLTFCQPAGNFDHCRADVFEMDLESNLSRGKSRVIDFNCTDLDLRDLNPGIEYKLAIHAVVSDAKFGQRNSMMVNYWISTPGRAPGAVQNVIIQNITSSSASVTWSKPASANGYITGYDVVVCVDEHSNKDLVQEKKMPCNVSCVNVTLWKSEQWLAKNLCVATNYFVNVTASNQYKNRTNGQIMYSVSPIRTQTFSTLSVVPIIESDVTVVALNATTVRLSWAVPVNYPGPTSYIIIFRTSNTVHTTVIHGYVNNNALVTGLMAFTNYTWTFSANTSAGPSGNISGTITTKEAESDRVTKLKVTGSTPNTITVTWARPSHVHGFLRGYAILVRVSSNLSECKRAIILQRNTTTPIREVNQTVCRLPYQTFRVYTSNTTYTITNLEPCETYTFYVAAYNGFGVGLWTSVTSSTAVSAPRSSQPLTCSSPFKATLSVSWIFEVATKCAINYSISVYKSDQYSTSTRQEGTSYTKINQTYTRSQNLTFSGLKNFWTYKFNVTASSSAGSASNVIVCRTLSDAPGQVQHLSVQQAPGRPKELQVTWQCPDDDNKNGPLKKFYLVRTSQSDQSYQQIIPVGENLCYPDSSEDVCRRSYISTLPAFPDRNYTISVKVQNCEDVFGPISDLNFYNPALVPPKMPWFPLPSDNVERTLNSTSFTVSVLPSRLLDNSTGAILSFGIIVCRSEFCDIDAVRKWPFFVKNMATWAKSKHDHFETPYRVTNSSWEDAMRKQNVDHEVTFEVGTDTSCEKQATSEFCNGPLPFGKFFRARVFACTSAGCVVSNTTHDYVTAASKSDSSDSIVIGGALAGIAVAIVVLVTVIVIKLRMRPKKPPRRKISNRMSQVIAMEEIVAPKDDGKSKPIKIKDFDATLVRLHADDNILLNQEYQELDKLSPLYPTDVGSDLDHRADNRWTNIVPFDHSRVKLTIPEGETVGHDYINANFIAGLDSKHDYIATQGPLTRTVPDFWRMIWEQQVSVIVMLSDFAEKDKRTSMIREKVARYFPDEEESNSYQYGQILVARTGKLDSKYWEIRTLKLTHATEKKNRFVKHFFFKFWSDHEADINPTDLIEFVRVVQAETNTQPRAPLVVHCSAGVGRTGTFIAVDYFNRLISGMKQKVDKTKSSVRDNWTVDIFGRVLSMRDKRRFMVQSRTQYIFIYDVVQELLKQAFKSEKVKCQDKGETYEDGPSTSSGSAKEDAVYDDVELLKGQMTVKDQVVIRDKRSGSSTDAVIPNL